MVIIVKYYQYNGFLFDLWFRMSNNDTLPPPPPEQLTRSGNEAAPRESWKLWVLVPLYCL